MKALVLVLMAAVLSAAPTRIAAQCVPSEVAVVELRGRVVSTYSGGHEACAGAEVELRSGSGKVLQTTRADEEGRFIFVHVRPGRYAVGASFPLLISFYAPVRLVKSKAAAASLLINLGVDARSECGGGWVKPDATNVLVGSPPNKRVQRSARSGD